MSCEDYSSNDELVQLCTAMSILQNVRSLDYKNKTEARFCNSKIILFERLQRAFPAPACSPVLILELHTRDIFIQPGFFPFAM